MLTKNITILFQGDSITDSGRREDPEGLGNGYARMVATCLSSLYPDYNITFINRGISGDRVISLLNRWQQDCLDLKPDVMTIMIGINDTWRSFDSNDITDADTFEVNYDKIISDALKAGIKIVILEPYLLPTREGQEKWWQDLAEKQQAVRRLANKYKLPFIPFDGLFAKAVITQESTDLTPDGVHPGVAGCRLIAQEIIKVLTK